MFWEIFSPNWNYFCLSPFVGLTWVTGGGPGGPLTMCLLGLKCFSPLLQTWHKKMATGASFICTQNIYFYIYYLVFRTYLLYSASATYRGDYEYLARINWDRCKYNIYCVNCIIIYSGTGGAVCNVSYWHARTLGWDVLYVACLPLIFDQDSGLASAQGSWHAVITGVGNCPPHVCMWGYYNTY